MPILTDIVQVTADDTNVYSGRLGAKVPTWARRVRVQVVASDTDWLVDLSIGGVELMRTSAPHVAAADNLQEIDFRRAHCVVEIGRTAPTDFEILCNVNVVTAGVGLVGLQWE